MTHNNLRGLASLALLSASGIALEITLTRLLSVVYFPPTIFAALSLAILGVGVGAALAAWRDGLREVARIKLYIALAGITAVLISLPVVMFPSAAQIALLGLMLVLPYIFIGLALSIWFSAAPERSRLLYAADLVGAGIGAIAVIPLLDLLGALNGLLFVGIAFLLSRLVWDYDRNGAALAAAGIVLLGSNVAVGWLDVNMAALNDDKPIVESLRGSGEILATRWDSFARTDLVQPDGDGDQPRRIYVDGAAASIIPPAQNNTFLMSDVGLFGFVTAQPQRVFIIGSGGGLDVWFGLRVGASEITAVEVNPASIDLVDSMSAYSGDVYGQPNVEVIVDEGRSVLRRAESDYDLIYLSQVVTLSAERTGYALTENTIYTVEAFQDYLNHLAEPGYLVLKLYDEPTLSRAVSIAIHALRIEQDLTDAEALQHIIALLDPDTSPPTPLLIVRSTPFQPDEVQSIGRAAQQVGFASLYLPGIQAAPPLAAVEFGEQSYDSIIEAAEINLAPPTDNQPFFYQFERGLPSEMRGLLIGMGVVVLIALGLAALYKRSTSIPTYWATVGYFAALGLSFIMVEIALIQQMRLFIGHPTIAVTLILATLLIGGGIGNLLYRRFAPQLQAVSWTPPAAVILMLVSWLLVWPPLSQQFLAASLPIRMIVVVVMIIPLALVMGIPFAVGLHVVGSLHSSSVALAWSVNGVATVVGSVLAVALALLAGFNLVLLIGAAGYVGAALAARALKP